MIEINSVTLCQCRGYPGEKRTCFYCDFETATKTCTNTHLFLIMSLISYYVTHLGIRARLSYSWNFEGKPRCDSKTAHAMLYLGCTSVQYRQYLDELLVAMAPSSTGVIASFANHGQ